MANENINPKLALMGDHSLLRPFELTIADAVRRIHEGLFDYDQASESEIEKALIEAIKSEELHPVRGSLQRHQWSVPEPILNAREVESWAKSVGLELSPSGTWYSYLFDEIETESALIDRLQALRSFREMESQQDYEARIRAIEYAPDVASLEMDNAQKRDKMISLMDENSRLRRELNMKKALDPGDEEPDPKSRNTYLRIIAAMMDLAGFHPERKENVSTIKKKIDSALQRLGAKPISSEGTISDRLKDVRNLIERDREATGSEIGLD
ncbi:hypothetical protein [Thiocystis violacea]|uniref:hypothetical protein n=1 Tax=Thiocystis violacea TaxID=13725 RepID=UPI0019043CA7|nr:hypothetical protein [Thiocystis violacea]MBK1723216.1 hypothetical protein [Thiocystis violacea]